MRARIGLPFSIATTCCLFLFNTAAQAITFADGLVHTIDAANSFPFESVVVHDGAGAAATTINQVAGGVIGTFNGNGLLTYDHSIVNISGGSWGNTAAFFLGTSIVNVTGGSPGTMVASGSSTLTYSGATSSFVGANSNATISVLSGFIDRLALEGLSQATLNGGHLTGNSHFAIELRGSSQLSIFGGTFPELVAFEQSTVEIFGSDFNVPLGNIAALSGTLTGTLSDGTPLNVSFLRAGGTITLVPEPGTGVLAMTGLLGLAFRQRRHGRAPHGVGSSPPGACRER